MPPIAACSTAALPGLAEYLDTTRMPAAYASYINTAPASDRFYDDNVWLGIDFCDIYEATGDKKYLAQAEMIWKFIESGTDDVLGGGIYWCEQKKHSKNTCSNAPGTVYALKLYAATGDGRYLEQGKGLYAWTKEHLLDTGTGSISITCRSTAISAVRSLPTTAARWYRRGRCFTRLRAMKAT